MLLISKIYKDIGKHSLSRGKPCVFVHLSSSRLQQKRAHETFDSSEKRKTLSVETVVKEIFQKKSTLVCITGPQPLAQRDTICLLEKLSKHGLTVLLETPGILSLKNIPDTVHISVNIPCPSDQRSQHFSIENFSYLKYGDELTFVLADRIDFNWAVQLLEECKVSLPVSFFPKHNVLKPRDLARWILEKNEISHFNLRLELDLHDQLNHMEN